MIEVAILPKHHTMWLTGTWK